MDDEKFMRVALEHAAKANPSPNPRVGACIVKNGQLLSSGFHAQAGLPHAEIEAMRKLSPSQIRGSTLYVTLEPCSHHGRTPPCTDAITKSGIARVVYGAQDPNPKVQGEEMLETAGVEVEGGVLSAESRAINQYFFFAMENKRPHVTLKWAMSLDGKIAAKTNASKWITGEEARARARQLRAQRDAVIVGVGTVLADDPTLAGPKFRVILDSSLRTPPSSRVFASGSTIIICSKKHDAAKASALTSAGAKIIPLVHTTPKAVLFALSKEGVNSVFVEGGSETHARFVAEKLYDTVIAYISPKIIGGKDAKTPVGGVGLNSIPRTPDLEIKSIAKIGNDVEIMLERI